MWSQFKKLYNVPAIKFNILASNRREDWDRIWHSSVEIIFVQSREHTNSVQQMLIGSADFVVAAFYKTQSSALFKNSL